MLSCSGPRASSAATTSTAAKPAWISSGSRSDGCASPRARAVAIVRDRSCSTGR